MSFVLKEDIDYIFKSIKEKTKKLEGKRLLISGGAGFLGTYFTEVIAMLNKNVFKKPCKVLIIDRIIHEKKRLQLKKNFLNSKFMMFQKKLILQKNLIISFMLRVFQLHLNIK